MFRLASADCVKLTLLDKATAAGRRRWAVKHDEQEKADLKAAAHTSHILHGLLLESLTKWRSIILRGLPAHRESTEMEGGRKRRSLRAQLKHANESLK